MFVYFILSSLVYYSEKKMKMGENDNDERGLCKKY